MSVLLPEPAEPSLADALLFADYLSCARSLYSGWTLALPHTAIQAIQTQSGLLHLVRELTLIVRIWTSCHDSDQFTVPKLTQIQSLIE